MRRPLAPVPGPGDRCGIVMRLHAGSPLMSRLLPALP
jgi:hypothetical protein